ncbi:MAG: Rieske 2Fe-2S domain-containing protein [Anaerolineae bacterium]|nr:Rieske 2Fe-2S domain-containing protein [Anaerolineae bacterium]
MMPRRDFLSRVWAGLGLAAAAGSGYVGLRFLASQTAEGNFGGVVTAGMVEDFPLNTVTPFPNARFFLVRQDDGGFLALYHKCTHLACTLLWRETDDEFYCPCHGSRFQADGRVHNRPASRSLSCFPVSFEGDTVLVDTGSLIERDQVEPGDIVYPSEAAP